MICLLTLCRAAAGRCAACWMRRFLPPSNGRGFMVNSLVYCFNAPVLIVVWCCYAFCPCRSVRLFLFTAVTPSSAVFTAAYYWWRGGRLRYSPLRRRSHAIPYRLTATTGLRACLPYAHTVLLRYRHHAVYATGATTFWSICSSCVLLFPLPLLTCSVLHACLALLPSPLRLFHFTTLCCCAGGTFFVACDSAHWADIPRTAQAIPFCAGRGVTSMPLVPRLSCCRCWNATPAGTSADDRIPCLPAFRCLGTGYAMRFCASVFASVGDIRHRQTALTPL
jgi:hypothetical protein